MGRKSKYPDGIKSCACGCGEPAAKVFRTRSDGKVEFKTWLVYAAGHFPPVGWGLDKADFFKKAPLSEEVVFAYWHTALAAFV